VLQNVDNIYIIRQVSEDPGNEPKPGTPTKSTPGNTGDPLAPRSEAPSLTKNIALLDVPASGPSTAAMTGAAPAAAANTAAGGFEFSPPTPPGETRVIRVPVSSLKNGDLRYNIVIRPRDLILVPNPVVGEYYMGGHVNRTGVYSLTGRQITLKQAIISAGMMDAFAIPQRCDIVRRIGPEKEVFCRVNLDGIFSGTEPDIYLKPNDIVQIGTNALAPFIAGIRNGFRITYGFGFLYDRNFAPQQPIGN